MNLRVWRAGGAWPALVRSSNALLSGLIVAAGIVLMVALRLGWISLLPHAEESAGPEAADAAPAAPTEVTLPPEKLAAAGLQLATVARQVIRPTRAVPGTITYDAAKRLPIEAPVAGVVLKVLVEPAQRVAEQQPLAVMSSPEVGLARNDVLRREAELAIARKESAWAAEIAKNVPELLALFAQHPKLAEIEANLDERTLGDYREKLIAAYSKLVLAETVAESSGGLDGGAVSRRLIEERTSAREVADAQFSAACETARFEAAQARDQAAAAAQEAERLLVVAEQTLVNLLGPLADRTPVTDREKLSELVLLAPRSGRVEERPAVEGARLAAGDPLFTISDTETLWVEAQLHERDWSALPYVQQGDISVRIPALGAEQHSARVRYVGVEVAPDTLSVPVVAELNNIEGRLKPGLFVWVEIPLAAPREAAVVPPGAIMRHENQPFVFVPAGERMFRRVNVEVGLETADAVEIRSGLAPGASVVAQGAFYLKSELLLEREE